MHIAFCFLVAGLFGYFPRIWGVVFEDGRERGQEGLALPEVLSEKMLALFRVLSQFMGFACLLVKALLPLATSDSSSASRIRIEDISLRKYVPPHVKNNV